MLISKTIRAAIAEEREACAKIVEGCCSGTMGPVGEEIAAAIRGRP